MIIPDHLHQSLVLVHQALVMHRFRVLDHVHIFENPEDLQKSNASCQCLLRGCMEGENRAHRLVVPSTFFPVLLAEHTTTSLLSFRFGLIEQLARLPVIHVRPIAFSCWRSCSGPTHLTMSSAMFRANFPTLVPPNFCTTQERLPLLFCGALETVEGAPSCPFAVSVALILQGVGAQAGRGGERGEL